MARQLLGYAGWSAYVSATATIVTFGTAIGGWLTLSSYLSLSSRLFPRGLAWAGVLAGVGYIVTVAGFMLGGYQNPVFYAGGLLTVISYSAWAFWLGRVLVSGQSCNRPCVWGIS